MSTGIEEYMLNRRQAPNLRASFGQPKRLKFHKFIHSFTCCWHKSNSHVSNYFRKGGASSKTTGHLLSAAEAGINVCFLSDVRGNERRSVFSQRPNICIIHMCFVVCGWMKAKKRGQEGTNEKGAIREQRPSEFRRIHEASSSGTKDRFLFLCVYLCKQVSKQVLVGG